MQQMRRPWLWTIVIIIAAFALARVYFRLTDDFRVSNITYEMPYHVEWDVPPPTGDEKKLLDFILAQKFYYIGKGAQSYAFYSEDGNYVLKFFKFKHLRPNWIMNFLPPLTPFMEYRDRQAMVKERRLYGVFDGYRLAYALHKPESGLIFIHLNPTNGLYPKATVYDKIGLKRTIQLDDVVFILQQKAKTTRVVINSLLKTGQFELAKQRIRQTIDMYLTEYRKGIYDKDHGVMHNTGFVGENPIHLDVGKLVHEPNMQRQEFWQPDLEKIGWKFARWIKENYPEAYPEIATDIEAKFTEVFGHRFDFASSLPPPPKKKR